MEALFYTLPSIYKPKTPFKWNRHSFVTWRNWVITMIQDTILELYQCSIASMSWYKCAEIILSSPELAGQWPWSITQYNAKTVKELSG